MNILLIGDSHSDGAGTFGAHIKAFATAAGHSMTILAASGASAKWYTSGGRMNAALRAEIAKGYDLYLVVLGTNETDYVFDGGSREDVVAMHTALRKMLPGRAIAVGPPDLTDANKQIYANVVINAMNVVYADFVDSQPITSGLRHTAGSDGKPGVHYASAEYKVWARGVWSAIGVVQKKATGWRVAVGVGLALAGVFAGWLLSRESR